MPRDRSRAGNSNNMRIEATSVYVKLHTFGFLGGAELLGAVPRGAEGLPLVVAADSSSPMTMF